MAVSSGQTAAQTQERGPKELHSVGPGRARPGRELRSVGFPLASPRYSRHRDHKTGLLLTGLRLFELAPPDTSPAPASAWRALPQGLVAKEVEEGKILWEGGLRCPRTENAPGSAQISP